MCKKVFKREVVGALSCFAKISPSTSSMGRLRFSLENEGKLFKSSGQAYCRLACCPAFGLENAVPHVMIKVVTPTTWGRRNDFRKKNKR